MERTEWQLNQGPPVIDSAVIDYDSKMSEDMYRFTPTCPDQTLFQVSETD